MPFLGSPKAGCLKRFQAFPVKGHGGYPGRGPSHVHVVFVVDDQADFTPGHLDRDLAVAGTHFSSYRSSGRATAARCQGVTGPAFPDFYPDAVTIQDLE